LSSQPDDAFQAPNFTDGKHRFQNLLSTGTGFYFAEELNYAEFQAYEQLNKSSAHAHLVARARAAMKAWRSTVDPSVHIDPELIDALIPYETSAFPITLHMTDRYSAKVQLADKPLYVFLAGDAAHTTHFLGGSGFNQGVADVMLLIEMLKRSPSEALQVYQQVSANLSQTVCRRTTGPNPSPLGVASIVVGTSTAANRISFHPTTNVKLKRPMQRWHLRNSLLRV
jgi:hypothetical protein